jgi:ceramide glucosyltransferase
MRPPESNAAELRRLASRGLLAAAWIGSVALGAELACLWHVRRRHLPDARAMPACSILKPLKGLADELESNLSSHLDQDYRGEVEMLLGVAPDDPAEPLARAFAARHPEQVRLVVHDEAPGCNPKVNQLIALTREARHELISCTDATIRVPRGWLRETAAALQLPGVALATHLVAGTGEQRLGAAWDGQALVAFVAPNVAVAATVGMDQVIGKSLAIGRRTLDAVGGWERFKDFLGEDQLLGRELAQLGARSYVCPTPVLDVIVGRSVGGFWSRQTRWSMMRFRLVRPGVFLEPLLNPTALAACAVACAERGERQRVATAALTQLALSLAFTQGCSWLMRGHGFRPRHLLLAPIQQLAFLAVWLRGATMRTVSWQGSRLRVGARTQLYDVRPSAIA